MKHEYTIWYEDEHGEPRIFATGIEVTLKQAVHMAQKLEQLTGRPTQVEQD